MAFIKPTIQGLQPENTIRIHPIGGGALGISDYYEMELSLTSNPKGAYNCVAILQIVNSGFYRFENDFSTREYYFTISQQGERVRLSFRIRNRGISAFPLILSVCTYDQKSDPSAQLCQNAQFKVVIGNENIEMLTFE